MIWRDYQHGLVFIWLLTAPAFSGEPNSSEILDQFLTDPELVISEDDLDRLEALTFLNRQDDSSFVHLVRELSFLSRDDMVFIQNFSGENIIMSIRNGAPVSEALRKVVDLVPSDGNRKPGPGYVQLRLTEGTHTKWTGKGRWSFRRLACGWTLARGSDEPLSAAASSFYITYSRQKMRVLLGDYQILSGLGYQFWRFTPVQKSYTTVRTGLNPSIRIQPFRSSYSSWSLRGLAAQWSGTGLKASLAYSRRPVRTTSTGDPLVLSATGWQTGNQIESLTAAGVEATGKRGLVGVMISHAMYSGSSRPWENTQVFGFGRFEKRPWRITGEWSLKKPHSGALAFSLRTSKLKYRVILRQARLTFSGSRPNPMLEWKSAQSREKGLYQGFTITVGRQKLTMFADLFRQTETKSGYETGLEWEYRRGNQRFRWQWKHEEKQQDQAVYYQFSPPPAAGRVTRSAVHYWNLSPTLRWKNQWLMVSRSHKAGHPSFGMQTTLFYHSGSHGFECSLFSVTVRDYATRLYFWDVNLPGEMRALMLSETRNSLAIKYQFSLPTGSQIAWRVRWQYPRPTGKTRFDGGIVFTAAL